MAGLIIIWMVFTVLSCILYASAQAVNLTSVTPKHIHVDVFCKSNPGILCSMMYKFGCCCTSFRIGGFTITLSDTGSGNISSRFHHGGIVPDTVKRIGVQNHIIEGGHGNKCERDEECIFRHAVCFGGVCLCSIGLYFSPSQNDCLRECDEYGDEMDLYTGGGILGHNDMYVRGTADECMNRCVQTVRFTCLTVDIKVAGEPHMCALSRLGFMDVAEKDRVFGNEEWAMGQRRCK